MAPMHHPSTILTLHLIVNLFQVLANLLNGMQKVLYYKAGHDNKD